MLCYLLLVLPALCAHGVRGMEGIYGSLGRGAVLSGNSVSDLRINKRESAARYPFLATVGWTYFTNFEIGHSPWEPICGGSVITDIHIITAAHCIANSGHDRGVGVLLGPHGPSKTGMNVDDILTPRSVHIHPNYRLENDSGISYSVNDIAILTLENPLVWSDQVNPICLLSSLGIIEASVTVMMGPGNEYSPVPVLMEKLYPLKNCVHLWKNPKKMNPYDLFCTHPRSIKICPGEAGGPLVWFNKKSSKYIQFGIHSFGNSCKLPDKPIVFAKVPTYINWIENIVRSSGDGTLRQLCLKQLELCVTE